MMAMMALLSFVAMEKKFHSTGSMMAMKTAMMAVMSNNMMLMETRLIGSIVMMEP